MNNKQLTSKERILVAATGGIPDRVPVAPMVWDYAAVFCGKTIKEYALNPKVMAECLIRFYNTFKPDGIFVGTDVYYVAEGFGAKILIREDNVPVLVEPAIQDLSEIDKLQVPNPYTDGRMPVVLECINILKQELPEVTIFAIGGQATWSCAMHVAGMERFVMEATFVDKEMDEGRPELVYRLFDLTTEAYIKWQKAQIEAGADIARISDSAASINLISPSIYKKMVHPYHKQIVRELKNSYPNVPIAKHTCGNNTPVLDLWAEEGLDLADIDYQMDLGMVKEKIGNKFALYGNVDPSGVMVQGTVEDVKNASIEAIDKAANNGGFILGTGCVVPFTAPADNIQAMINVARTYNPYK
ncbi:uroporphyrinogen decarboxylase family protein [Moorella naiadis]|uniref:uroporphyrinogen decarboxylase family protein n=1 Tax=Moorella naiadis (nom. illeg.) TaxID=3093670 RepID=UPI003D9CA4CC